MAKMDQVSLIFFEWKKETKTMVFSLQKKHSLVVLAKVHRLLEFVLESVTPMV
jgi:hypothetical protein